VNGLAQSARNELTWAVGDLYIIVTGTSTDSLTQIQPTEDWITLEIMDNNIEGVQFWPMPNLDWPLVWPPFVTHWMLHSYNCWHTTLSDLSHSKQCCDYTTLCHSPLRYSYL
jgi:hypothetical protein